MNHITYEQNCEYELPCYKLTEDELVDDLPIMCIGNIFPTELWVPDLETPFAKPTVKPNGAICVSCDGDVNIKTLAVYDTIEEAKAACGVLIDVLSGKGIR